MANPAWFKFDVFMAQKADQLNVMKDTAANDWLAKQEGAPTRWDATLAAKYLDEWTAADGSHVPGATTEERAYNNFLVCNQDNYSGVDIKQVNVSANALFDVDFYLQGVADNANKTGYEASGVAKGGWTVENVLTHMFNDGKMSAWDHFKNQGMKDGINPSADFNTDAYLTARAEAAGMTKDALIDKLIKDGNNPVMDYELNGKSITLEKAPEPTVKVPANWTPWGENTGPDTPTDDPFEQNVTNVAVKADQLNYPGEGETYSGNTQFDAAYGASAAGNNLNAKDVFVGPEGQHNTLSVTLGRNWNGFNGVKQEDGSLGPSVDNIGRIELLHDARNNEKGITFDAKNISDAAYRYDLVAADGPGSISLKNLSDAVTEIHISDLTPPDVNAVAPVPTTLSFAHGVNKGSADALTLVLENVGGTGDKAAAIKSDNWGIEELTIETRKGEGGSGVDLQDLAGIKTLKFAGAGDIEVTGVASGIKTYDASAATGDVNMMVVNPSSNSTVVKGGSGNDTVTIGSNVGWRPLGLEGVENLAIVNGGSFDLRNVDAGLTDLWVFGTKDATVKNLTASDFIVHQVGDCNTTVTGDKDGSLNNLTWITSGDDFSFGKVLTTNADGHVTLDLQDESAFGATLKADNATALTVHTGGAFEIESGSSLKALQDVIINLEDSKADVAAKVDIALPSAQNVTVNASGQDVTFNDLGQLKKGVGDINVDANDVGDFSVGNLSATVGNTITVNIDASAAPSAKGAVKIGNITNSTTQLEGGEGDIHVIVAGASVGSSQETTPGTADSVAFVGGPITINFEDVTGGAFASGGLTLKSSGSISYIGAAGDDNLTIEKVGDYANIDLGDSSGGDSLKIANLGSSATINVTCGDGKDTIGVIQQSAKTTINVTDFTAGEDVLTLTDGTSSSKFANVISTTTAAAAVKALEQFDISASESGVQFATLDIDGTGAGAGAGGILFGDNLYLMDSLTAGKTLIVVEDVEVDGSAFA